MANTDLRDRIAAALVAEMRRTIICPPPGGIGAIGGTEFDLANAAIAVVQPELDRLREVEQVHQELTDVRAHPLITCAHGVRTVHVADLARKIAEKRTALHQRAEACREVDRLRRLLQEILQTFVHKTHPGAPCLQSDHVDVETVQRWRDALYTPGGSDGS